MLFHSEFRFDFQRLIIVIVGEEQASFSVHAHILRQKLPFFEAALSSRWNDKELPTIEMPEDDPAIFNTFVAWAYTNEVEAPSILENDVTEPDPQIMNNWLDLYVYADKLQAQEMKNVVIEFFLEAGPKIPKMDPSAIAQIWNHLPRKDMLRILLYHTLLYRATDNVITKEMCTEAPSLVATALKHFLKRRTPSNTRFIDDTFRYQHGYANDRCGAERLPNR